MDVDTLPEIQRASLISTLLSLKKMGIDDILGFDFIDPPDQNLVLGGLRQLWMLGALDAQGNLTEEVGGKMAEFPVSPFLSRAIIESSLTLSGCSAEMIVLASILSVEDLFVTPRGGERKQREAEDVWAKAGFHHKSGDHAT